jgi:branched-chain amino acid transport system ATP-binding protein
MVRREEVFQAMAVPVLSESAGTADGLLEVANVEVVYNDSIVALRGVSLTVPEGGFVSVLGTNGAGKTTLIRAITSLLFVHKAKITEGEIHLKGKRISGAPSDVIVKGGICQVPEGRMLFPSLTVEENLRVGASSRRDRSGINADIERTFNLFPQIADRRKDEAGWLSGGEQQMVAVGRALMARPKLLICDELSLGLAPQIVQLLFDMLRRVNERDGTSVLLIEQNARMALEYSRYGYILETGRVVLDGPSDVLRANEDVQEFYLGGSGEAKEAYEAIKHYKKRKRWLI